MEEPKAPGHDTICPKLPTSGMEGPGFELEFIFFLLLAPFILSLSPPPQHHGGGAPTLPLPMLFLDVPLLAAAQLNPSVWSNPKCNGRERRGVAAQAEGGKECKGVYVGP